LFLVFHTKPRMDKHTKSHLHETPWVVTAPLILLAIPSVIIGALTITPLIMSSSSYFEGSIVVHSGNDVLAQLAEHFHGVFAFTLHAPLTLPFWLALAGIITAWLCYQRYPHVPVIISEKFSGVYQILLDKYGFDRFNEWFFIKGSRNLGDILWKDGDIKAIDGFMVNGSARVIDKMAHAMKSLQSGFLNQYAFTMIIGLVALVSWWFWALV
jgi:NADH-quinone oxidoreductase subunit L